MSSQLSQGGENMMCMIYAFFQHRQPVTIFLFHRNFSQDTEVLASLVPLSLCGQMKFSPFALLGHTEGLQSNTISSKVLQTNFFITEIVASQSFTKDWKVSETFKKPKPLPAENRSAGIFQTTFTLSCNSPCMCGFHYNRD